MVGRRLVPSEIDLLRSVASKTAVVKTEMPPLEDMFPTSRFTLPWSDPRMWLYCFVYLPTFGVALLIFRLVVWFAGHFIVLCMPTPCANAAWKPVLFLLGIWTKLTGKEVIEELKEEGKPFVLVSNHITDHDAMALQGEIRTCMIASTHYWSLPLFKRLHDNMGTIWVEKTKGAKHDVVKEQVVKCVSDPTRRGPLYIMSEGGLTNGKVGLMRFNKFVYGLGQWVVPMALTVENPWPIELDNFGTNVLVNMLVLLTAPYVRFTYKLLPPMRILSGETEDEFANRVQAAVAAELGVVPTQYCYKDKLALRQKMFGK